MRKQSFAKLLGAVVTLVAIALAVMMTKATHAYANDDGDHYRIRIGFEIAPVPLNLKGKDPAKVGLGSYLVNAVGDCNGCHTAGGLQTLTLRQAETPTSISQPWSILPST
jgi:hypothetical protein